MRSSIDSGPFFARKKHSQEPSINLPLFAEHESRIEKLIRSQPPVTPEMVANKRNLSQALRFTFENAGLEDKEAAGLLKIAEAQFSRILNGAGKAHFPHDRLVEYMRRFGNIAPLIWLAAQFGYQLVPIRSEWEAKLAEKDARISALEQRLDHITDFVRQTRSGA